MPFSWLGVREKSDIVWSAVCKWVSESKKAADGQTQQVLCLTLRIGAVQEEEERVYFPSPFLVNFSKTEAFLQPGSLVAKSDQVEIQKTRLDWSCKMYLFWSRRKFTLNLLHVRNTPGPLCRPLFLPPFYLARKRLGLQLTPAVGSELNTVVSFTIKWVQPWHWEEKYNMIELFFSAFSYYCIIQLVDLLW